MARARITDPETSHDAAASIPEVRITLTRQRVLALLHREGPMSDADLWHAFASTHGERAASPSGLRTRRAELAAAGLVVDTGQRRQLPSGRYAVVWGRK